MLNTLQLIVVDCSIIVRNYSGQADIMLYLETIIGFHTFPKIGNCYEIIDLGT